MKRYAMEDLTGARTKGLRIDKKPVTCAERSCLIERLRYPEHLLTRLAALSLHEIETYMLSK